MTELEKLRALLAEAREAMDCEECGEYVDGDERLRERIDAALAETVPVLSECSTPKCEHGVEYGGMGVGLCPRCDQKALVLASDETPTVKA